MKAPNWLVLLGGAFAALIIVAAIQSGGGDDDDGGGDEDGSSESDDSASSFEESDGSTEGASGSNAFEICDVVPESAYCLDWSTRFLLPDTPLSRLDGDLWAREALESEFDIDFEALTATIEETDDTETFDRCVDTNDGETYCLPRMPLIAQRQLGCIPTSEAGLVAALSGSATLLNLVSASEIVASDDPEAALTEELLSRLIMLGKQCDFLNELRNEYAQEAQIDLTDPDGQTTVDDRIERLNQLAESDQFGQRFWTDIPDDDLQVLTDSISSYHESRHISGRFVIPCSSIRIPRLRIILPCV